MKVGVKRKEHKKIPSQLRDRIYFIKLLLIKPQ